MVNLSIDFEKILPFVVDAYTKVYGEEYRDIVFQRINNAAIIPYYDIEGLDDYLSGIKRCKRREYAIKFLDKIGVDIEKYKKNNYMQDLDNAVEKVLEYYIGGSNLGFGEHSNYWAPLQAFKISNVEDSEKILENKIKIINFLLDDNHEQITETNFDLFVGTEEYQRILEKIDKLNIVYEQLLLEYRNWEKQLQPYEKFIESQNRIKSKILIKKKLATFMKIYSRLPKSVKKAISGKSLVEKTTAVLGSLDISSLTIIEAFSHNYMEKLKSKDVSSWNKCCILTVQISYLKNMGIEIPKQVLKCNSEEDVNNYLKFLNQDNIKMYIPSDDLISYITALRKYNYEEALRKYYMNRDDFLELKRAIGDDEETLEYIYSRIKNKTVSISGEGGAINDNEFISIMFYAISTNFYGRLFYCFTHECGHIVDQSINGIGFENSDEFNENSEKNPYDKNFRKYEKFNETLNDIFAMEAVELLHNQDIYLIEPLEFTLLDVSDFNTALITKNLLKPLVSKFRQQVIRAKVRADRSELIRYIGERNFEELVDVVNKVDYLSRKGVASRIESSPDDAMVKEYFEQVERAKRIYNDIDYYSNSLQNSVVAPNEESKKAK